MPWRLRIRAQEDTHATPTYATTCPCATATCGHGRRRARMRGIHRQVPGRGQGSVLRRSHRQEEELEVSSESGDLELLIETEEDDGPLVAINTDGESELVVSSSMPNVILEDEEEIDDHTLSDELEAKVEAARWKSAVQKLRQNIVRPKFSQWILFHQIYIHNHKQNSEIY